MICEICGKEAKLFRILIEGTEMMVCKECSQHGKILPHKKKVEKSKIKKVIPYSRDIFKEMNKDLIPNWGKEIKRARERKRMTREELGAKVGEKTTTIAKIENEELRPRDETVKKLEKVLEIKLFQEIGNAIIKPKKTKPLTLGDLIKNEIDRKSD